MGHRSRFADNLGAATAQLLAGVVNIVDTQSQMAEAIANIVFVGVPVVGGVLICGTQRECGFQCGVLRLPINDVEELDTVSRVAGG